MEQRWPDTLWIVRHGESAGNVARDEAYAAGLAMIDIAERDVDVPSTVDRWASRPSGILAPRARLVHAPLLRLHINTCIILAACRVVDDDIGLKCARNATLYP